MRIAKGRNFPESPATLPLPYVPNPRAAAAAPERPAGQKPIVLAGCFRGLPEAAFLDEATGENARLVKVEGRGHVLLAATVLQPHLVILPSADARGVSTCSIVSRCLSLAPPEQMRMLVVMSLLPGGRRSVRSCACPGAELGIVTSAGELTDVIASLLRPREHRPLLRLA